MAGIWALALAGGCAGTSAPPVALEHRSVLEIETRGLALSADGSRGHAGMYGVTCDFRTRSAEIGADYDYPSEDEGVEDGFESVEDGFVTVTASPDRVHLTFLDGGSSVDLRAPNVVHARLLDGRVAVVRDSARGCVAQVLAPGGGVRTVEGLPDGACVPGVSVTVDRERGVLFIAAGDEGVLAVDEAGWEPLGVHADAVSWDERSGVLYVGAGDEVGAVTVAGTSLWTASAGGWIRDLAHLGELRAVAVSVESDLGGGGVLVLDGATGELRADVPTPSAADQLVGSASGEVLALVNGSQTHFFDVER